jgi:hypothetical protein
MATRTTIISVTFKRPFVLGDFDEVQPAGAYRVETDEELLDGLSFPAYRRTLTLLHLHAQPGHPGRTQMLEIDPKDLEAALERDQTAAKLRENLESGVSVEVRSASPEPKLEDLMADPIFHLVMRSDGLSQAAVWGAIKTARAHVAAGSDAQAPISAEEPQRVEADRRAIERGESEGMLV